MSGYRELPVELQWIILRQIPTRDLYDAITEQISAKHILYVMGYTLADDNVSDDDNKENVIYFLKQMQDKLLGRRGPQASYYQTKMVDAWLKQGIAQLPFIQHYADKRAFLAHLESALKDPHSTYAHKIRCALLIHQIAGKRSQITNHIPQPLFNDLPSPVENDSDDAFSEYTVTALHENLKNEDAVIRKIAVRILGKRLPHLPTAEREQTVTALLNMINDPVYVVCEAAASALGIQGFYTAAEFNTVIQALLSKLNDKDWEILMATFGSLITLAADASQTQLDKIIEALDSMDLDRATLPLMITHARALGAIHLYATTKKRHQLIENLLARLNDPNVYMYHCPLILHTMNAVIRYASDVQRQAMIGTIISSGILNHEYEVLSEAISILIPHLTNPELNSLLNIPLDSTHTKRTLKLFAETQLYLNRQKPNPDLVVRFSREGHSMTQEINHVRTGEPVEARTLRFFSQAGDKPRSFDDCMTTVSRAKRL